VPGIHDRIYVTQSDFADPPEAPATGAVERFASLSP